MIQVQLSSKDLQWQSLQGSLTRCSVNSNEAALAQTLVLRHARNLSVAVLHRFAHGSAYVWAPGHNQAQSAPAQPQAQPSYGGEPQYRKPLGSISPKPYQPAARSLGPVGCWVVMSSCKASWPLVAFMVWNSPTAMSYRALKQAHGFIAFCLYRYEMLCSSHIYCLDLNIQPAWLGGSRIAGLHALSIPWIHIGSLPMMCSYCLAACALCWCCARCASCFCLKCCEEHLCNKCSIAPAKLVAWPKRPPLPIPSNRILILWVLQGKRSAHRPNVDRQFSLIQTVLCVTPACMLQSFPHRASSIGPVLLGGRQSEGKSDNSFTLVIRYCYSFLLAMVGVALITSIKSYLPSLRFTWIPSSRPPSKTIITNLLTWYRQTYHNNKQILTRPLYDLKVTLCWELNLFLRARLARDSQSRSPTFFPNSVSAEGF